MQPGEELPFRKFYVGAVLVVAVHSLALGAILTFKPSLFLEAAGWPSADNLFFPSQSGIFLVILGGGYCAALKYPRMVYFILFSKVVAISFLGTPYFFLNAPRPVLSAFLGDSAFTVLLVLVILLNRRGKALAG